jgi:hypothetical protein
MLVEVDVDNRNGDLLPGAYAQVHFALGAGAAPFTLPGNALLFRPDGVKVATVDAQRKVKLIPVSLGTDFGTRVAIASGLRGDEQVILNPQDSIVDGAPVRIVARKAEGASGASGAAAKGEGGVGTTGAALTGEKTAGAYGTALTDEKIPDASASTTTTANSSPTHISALLPARTWS